MAEGLEGQVALITGAGRGIGEAIALAFARQGMRLALGSRNSDQVERVASQCRELGAEALPLWLDVMNTLTCRRAVRDTLDQWGRLDVLVNNAGVVSAQRFTSIDDHTWEETLDVNLSGPYRMTRAALPSMLERGEGAVIAISSIAGKIGARYYAAYSASKHGLIGLMRSLAAEYARSGVTFNCVCPGFADTPMTEREIAGAMAKTGRSREEILRAMVTPQGRLVRPEEVAAVCVLLASPEGRGINGQAINVDGGQVQS